MWTNVSHRPGNFKIGNWPHLPDTVLQARCLCEAAGTRSRAPGLAADYGLPPGFRKDQNDLLPLVDKLVATIQKAKA